MHEVSLAFFWHQHQPYYPDDIGGENPMPWVRLHGTKDYWGMAKLLDEVPEMHATINLVPSLLGQLLAYTESEHQDTHLRISRLPADGLTKEDSVYLMDNFFMVNPPQMIHPYRRYNELYQKRGITTDSAGRAFKRFNSHDILDLQVWSNLVWIHPIAFELDSDLAEFRKKGRHWTELEKQWLLDKQLELLRDVVPLHAKLQKRGQIELTTTPFYHPIMPLLWDKRLARQAMPDVTLPKNLDGYHDDVQKQIVMAVEFHKKLFGRCPQGMWPSEGSVSQEIISAIAKSGIQWIATDEEILSQSTDGWVSRDSQGFLRNPEMLYRPWRVEHEGKSLEIVFRDHAMSDQIGFHYQRYEARDAVNDFIQKVEAIGRATSGNAGHRPTLLSIILDGENCWEYYPNEGVDFLRTLYRSIVKHPHIRSTRICDYLHEHPATDKLGHLFSGSWIQHNFGVWIGHPECNRAWDSLHQTRQFLQKASDEKRYPADKLELAWKEMYIAEGSDWFWWFGDDHSSEQDNLFDRLFRKHLQNVYLSLGEEPPIDLARPISQGHPHGRPYTEPTGLLNVKVDGRKTYFEWVNAGQHIVQGPRGAMNMAQTSLLSNLFFGFDLEQLYIRIDAQNGSARNQLAELDALRIVFFQPEKFTLKISNLNRTKPTAQLSHKGKRVTKPDVKAAVDSILELAIPFRSLSAVDNDPLHFCIELVQNKQSIERVPHEGAIEISVPSCDYESIMWQA